MQYHQKERLKWKSFQLQEQHTYPINREKPTRISRKEPHVSVTHTKGKKPISKRQTSLVMLNHRIHDTLC